MFTNGHVSYKVHKVHSYSSEVQTFIYSFIYIVWKDGKEGIDRVSAEHRNKAITIFQENRVKYDKWTYRNAVMVPWLNIGYFFTKLILRKDIHR